MVSWAGVIWLWASGCARTGRSGLPIFRFAAVLQSVEDSSLPDTPCRSSLPATDASKLATLTPTNKGNRCHLRLRRATAAVPCDGGGPAPTKATAHRPMLLVQGDNQ